MQDEALSRLKECEVRQTFLTKLRQRCSAWSSFGVKSTYAKPRHPSAGECFLGTNSTAEVEPKDANLPASCLEVISPGKPPIKRRTEASLAIGTPGLMPYAGIDRQGRHNNACTGRPNVNFHTDPSHATRFLTHLLTDGSPCDFDWSGTCMQLQSRTQIA